MQSAERGKTARRISGELREEKKARVEGEAALKLQSAERGSKARRLSGELREERRARVEGEAL